MGKLFDTIARAMIWCAGTVLIAAAVLVTLDVFLRKFVSFSIPATDEATSFAFAFSTSWAYAHVAIRNANIRIDFPYMTFPSRMRLVLDVIAMVAMAILLAWLAYRGAVVAQVSQEMDTRVMNPMRLPIAIFQLLWALGLAAGAVAALVALWRLLVALTKGDLEQAHEIAGGTRSADERIVM